MSGRGSSHRELTSSLLSLRPGRLLTLVGLDAAALVARLPAAMPPLLRLELAGAGTAETAVGRILDDLADLALAAWPEWPAAPLAPWRRAADRLAAAGRRPRFARVPATAQFSALHSAAGSPVLLFSLDPTRAERAAPLIATLEWACRHGAAVLALLAETPPCGPPWDRVLHGAVTVAPEPEEPALARLVPPAQAGSRGSAVERRMRAALRADPGLADLFEDEVTLHLGALGPTPRVDLLWRAGKVVVELDGAEHERDPNYGADRHRDYELLVAGYLVLRLTNAEVELDLARALDKVRRVVGLRDVSA